MYILERHTTLSRETVEKTSNKTQTPVGNKYKYGKTRALKFLTEKVAWADGCEILLLVLPFILGGIPKRHGAGWGGKNGTSWLFSSFHICTLLVTCLEQTDPFSKINNCLILIMDLQFLGGNTRSYIEIIMKRFVSPTKMYSS